MTETLHRPAVASRERHHLTADAFLMAALNFLVVIAVQESIALLLGAGDAGTWTPPVWLQAIGALGMPLRRHRWPAPGLAALWASPRLA